MLNILIYYLLIYETFAGSSNNRKAEETEPNIPTKGVRYTLEDEHGEDISESFLSLLDPHIDRFLSFVQDTDVEEIKEAVAEEREGEQHLSTSEENTTISEISSDVVKPPELIEVENFLDMTFDELAKSLEENLSPPITSSEETNYEPPLMKATAPQETEIVKEQTVILPLTFTGNLDEQLVILPLTFTGSADEQVIILQGKYAEDIQKQVITLQETFKGNIKEKVVKIPTTSAEYIDAQVQVDLIGESFINEKDSASIHETFDEHERVFENILESSKSFDPSTLSSMHTAHEKYDEQAVYEILSLSEEPFLGQLTELENIDEEIVDEILGSSEEPFQSELFKNQFGGDQPFEVLDLVRPSTLSSSNVKPSLIHFTPEQTQLEEENTYDSDVSSDSLTLNVVIHSFIDNLSSEPISFEEESIDLPTFAELINVPILSPTPSSTSESLMETEYLEEVEPLAESKINVPISSPTLSSTSESLMETEYLEEVEPLAESKINVPISSPTPSSTSESLMETEYLEEVEPLSESKTNVPIPSPTLSSTSESLMETEYLEEVEPLSESKKNVPIPSPTPISTSGSLIETLQPEELKPSEENIYFIKSIEPEPSTSSNIISPDIEEIYFKMVKSIKHILYKSFTGWYIERLDVIKKMINNIKISKHSTSTSFNAFKGMFDDKLLNICDKMNLRGKNLVIYELFEYESFDSIFTTALKTTGIYGFLIDFRLKYENQIFSILCHEFVQLFKYFPVFPELVTLGSLINQGKDDLLLIYIRSIHLILIENEERIEEMRSVVLFLIKKSFAIPLKRSKNINISLKVQINIKKAITFATLCNKNHSNLSFLIWEVNPSKHRTMKYYGKKTGEFVFNLNENKMTHFRAACYSIIFQQIMFTEYQNIPYEKYKELLDSLIDNNGCVFCLFEKYLDLLKMDLGKLEIKK